MYALLIDEKIIYTSNNKELLQEIIMDDYFDTEYKQWLNYCFVLPSLYNMLHMTTEIKYYTPWEWWKKFAAPMATSVYEIIDLEDYHIE